MRGRHSFATVARDGGIGFDEQSTGDPVTRRREGSLYSVSASRSSFAGKSLAVTLQSANRNIVRAPPVAVREPPGLPSSDERRRGGQKLKKNITRVHGPHTTQGRVLLAYIYPNSCTLKCCISSSQS